MYSNRILVEACVSSIDDAILASEAGVDRLELCVALEVDGITPTVSLFQEVYREIRTPIVALVRPRSGNFVYDKREVNVIVNDCERLLTSGAAQVAIGLLTPENEIDIEACRLIEKCVGGTQCSFHRAFDLVPDFEIAAKQLIDLGFKRILTSGGAANALAGSEVLRNLQQKFGKQIEILAAGSVRDSNAIEILEATGCRQLHGAFRSTTVDSSTPRIDPAVVRATCERIRQWSRDAEDISDSSLDLL